MGQKILFKNHAVWREYIIPGRRIQMLWQQVAEGFAELADGRAEAIIGGNRRRSCVREVFEHEPNGRGKGGVANFIN